MESLTNLSGYLRVIFEVEGVELGSVLEIYRVRINVVEGLRTAREMIEELQRESLKLRSSTNYVAARTLEFILEDLKDLDMSTIVLVRREDALARRSED